MLNRKIAFLGTGNMAEALIKGLLRSGTAKPEEIIATFRRKERMEEFQKSYPVQATLDNVAAAAEANVVVLSVKPQAMSKLSVKQIER